MLKKLTAAALCVLLAAGLMSCDSILEETNPNELSAETFYENQAQAESAVNAIYANLQTIGLYERRYFFIHDLLSNEAEGLPQLESDLNQFNTYQVTPNGNATLGENWDALYRGIQRANLVLENVPDVPENELDANTRNRYLAEARFLRAWHYYELVTQWGPVPLLRGTATQDEIPNGIPRAPRDSVYQLILEDLDFAEQNLPRKSEYAPTELGRASAGAAAALKGKAHLFRSSTVDGVTAWADAEAELEKFVGGGPYVGEYSLADDYFTNFTEEDENNVESIFEVQFTPTGIGWAIQGTGQSEATLRSQEYAFTSWQNTVPSLGLVNEYEEGDPRQGYTMLMPGDTYNGGQNSLPADASYPSWLKYTNLYKSNPAGGIDDSGINFRVIRFADVLLSLADAKIELGQIDEAVDLMNRVRARPSVDMPAYPTDEYPVGNREEALEALYHEIPVEFAGEQVFHKFQQRRPAYLEAWALDKDEYRTPGSETDSGFQLPKSILLPLPQSEIDANNALSNDDQNTGYD